VSDILREAAAAYAASGGELQSAVYEVKSTNWRVVYGRDTGLTLGRTPEPDIVLHTFGEAGFRTSAPTTDR
jgi:hypothetical protein